MNTKIAAYGILAAAILTLGYSVRAVPDPERRANPGPALVPAAFASVSDRAAPTGSADLANDLEVLGALPLSDTFALSIVRHRWQVIIKESNQVAIRPGSVYDIVTYFEQNAGFPRPRFNYLFLDTGLGTADPIYPIFQRGKQAGWGQLLPAMWSEKNRHINHASVLDTPEGCRVHSAYWVRHIDEFPDRYQRERADGYTLVDISFNYYSKLRPDAQCGRHQAHDPDPTFDPVAFITPYAETFTGFDQLPHGVLDRYEAKIGLLKLVSEEFDREKWPRFDKVYTPARNSLWYYPAGVRPDFGVDTAHPQTEAAGRLQAQDLIWPATGLRAADDLERVLGKPGFKSLLAFLDGEPIAGFDPKTEPGADALSLDQVTDRQYFTAGLERIPMGTPEEVRRSIADPKRYRLVSAVVRPYQTERDRSFPSGRVVPQVRLVYQFDRPRPAGADAPPFEQLFVHVNFDVIDRYAPDALRDQQHRAFLTALAKITGAGDSSQPARQRAANTWLETVAEQSPHRVSFSSALTGIWVFGTLSNAFNADRNLTALRIERGGIDVGYYSTAYDTVLFREARDQATGPRRSELERHLATLTPNAYRDPRRSDPHSLQFDTMTCAQCHQMAGRDAVHVALNDGLDRRFQSPVRTTEFLIRELDRQLASGQGYWQNR